MQNSEITIQDIADHANVSKSTVSRVLNNSSPVHRDKRSAVLQAMKTLGYQPNVFARSLAGGQSMTIGILTQNIGSPFYDTIAQGVIEGLAGTGYSPILKKVSLLFAGLFSSHSTIPPPIARPGQ